MSFKALGPFKHNRGSCVWGPSGWGVECKGISFPSDTFWFCWFATPGSAMT